MRCVTDTSIEAPPSILPQRKFCDITGLEVRHPSSPLPLSSLPPPLPHPPTNMIIISVHGSAPDIAGQNKANPIAAIRSAALMLRYMGFADGANRIDAAVDAVVRDGSVLTPDLGGRSGTKEVAAEILKRI